MDIERRYDFSYGRFVGLVRRSYCEVIKVKRDLDVVGGVVLELCRF